MEDWDGQGQRKMTFPCSMSGWGECRAANPGLMGGSAMALGDPTGGRFQNCLAFYLEASVQLGTAEPLLNL